MSFYEIDIIYPHDAKELIKLNVLGWIPTYFNNQGKKKKQKSVAEFIKTRLSSARIKQYQQFIADKNFIGVKAINKDLGIIGYCDGAIKGKEVAEIFGIYVLPGLTSLGIGKTLLDSFINQVHKQMPSVNFIELTVLEKNIRTIKFYKREGFKIISKQTLDSGKFIYRSGYRVLLKMRKTLI